jgi:hypothetical protein
VTRTHEGMQGDYSLEQETENKQAMHDAAALGESNKASRSSIVWMAILSILVFAAGLSVAAIFGGG